MALFFNKPKTPEQILALPKPDRTSDLKDAFRTAVYGRVCRTRGFQPKLGLPDVEVYRKAVVCESPENWKIVEVRSHSDNNVSTRHEPKEAMRRISEIKSGLNFFEAVEALSLYETFLEEQEETFVGRSKEEMGFEHYEKFAMREGIAFDVNGMPHATAGGEIVTNGIFTASMEGAVGAFAKARQGDKKAGAQSFGEHMLGYNGNPAVNLKDIIVASEKQSELEQFTFWLKSMKVFLEMQIEAGFDPSRFSREEFQKKAQFHNWHWNMGYCKEAEFPDQFFAGQAVNVKGRADDKNFIIRDKKTKREISAFMDRFHAYFCFLKAGYSLNIVKEEGTVRTTPLKNLKEAAAAAVTIYKSTGAKGRDIARLQANILNFEGIKSIPAELDEFIKGWDDLVAKHKQDIELALGKEAPAQLPSPEPEKPS